MGAIVLATGAHPFDPTIKGEYGYGRISGVVTNLEFERIVCATGPTLGSLITPGGRPVQRLAFIQCVGSRDRRFLPYCSGYCCTASIKEAMLALEHEPDAEVTIFYNDIRTSGKGFEELYLGARAAGCGSSRGCRAASGKAAMAARSSAMRTRNGASGGNWPWIWRSWPWVWSASGAPLPFGDLAPAPVGLGFYPDRHPILHPLESTLPGVFLAGTCQGPRDIAETVCQGSGVAAPGPPPVERAIRGAPEASSAGRRAPDPLADYG